MHICKSVDQFIQDFNLSNPRWQVVLNNGETIYQDDGRPEIEPPSAWIRLKNYCEKNCLHIVKMNFGFRSNMKSLPENRDGYFFSKGAVGVLGSNRSFSFFVVGTLNNGILNVTQWKTPEMLEQYNETRDIEKAKECLIVKNISQSTEQNQSISEAINI